MGATLHHNRHKSMNPLRIRTLTAGIELSDASRLDVIEAAAALLQRGRQQFNLGIDSSPAPAKDRSIAAAIEAFTHAPFGASSTLQACSVITAAIKSLDVKTCGYSGLMLPVLEDPLLAQRAGEGRYGIRDLFR